MIDRVGSFYFKIKRVTHRYESEDARSPVKSPHLLSYPPAALPLFTVYSPICWLIHALCSPVTLPLPQRRSRTEHRFTDSKSTAGLIEAGVAPTDGWGMLMWMWTLFRRLIRHCVLSAMRKLLRTELHISGFDHKSWQMIYRTSFSYAYDLHCTQQHCLLLQWMTRSNIQWDTE